MIWVTWRQHRAQAITCLALFGVLAVLAVTIGIQMRAAFGGDGLPACLARSGGADCPAVITSFVDRFGHGVSSIMNVPLIAIPGLLGVIVGAPLLGRELERGTWRLAWSQTVPRTRWLVAKLGLVTGGLVVFGAAVTAVMAWSHAPLYRVTSRLQPVPFNGDGLTFTASLLCAFGLAVLAGLLLRNTIAAIVIAYIGWEIPTTVVALMSGPIRIPAPAVMRIGCPAGCPGAGTGTVPPVTGHLPACLSTQRVPFLLRSMCRLPPCAAARLAVPTSAASPAESMKRPGPGRPPAGGRRRPARAAAAAAGPTRAGQAG